MTETIKIAFVSTILGMILSLPIALLAARNLNSPRSIILSQIHLGRWKKSTKPNLGNFLCNFNRARALIWNFCHDNLHGWLPR